MRRKRYGCDKTGKFSVSGQIGQNWEFGANFIIRYFLFGAKLKIYENIIIERMNVLRRQLMEPLVFSAEKLREVLIVSNSLFVGLTVKILIQ